MPHQVLLAIQSSVMPRPSCKGKHAAHCKAYSVEAFAHSRQHEAFNATISTLGNNITEFFSS